MTSFKLPAARNLRFATVLLGAAAGLALTTLALRAEDKPKAAAPAKPALTVSVVQPRSVTLPTRLSASGNIAAWQEASVGTEANGLRLADVRVNVGDVVRKGQVLAVFAAETAQADLAQSRAMVLEAEANLAEAAANAQRARELEKSGALSAQLISQYVTAERTAQAKLEAMRATARVQQLRVQQTQVLAPDDGVISSRTATVGAVLPAGQELFRLIRKGRLEWRAEVAATELGTIRVGMPVAVSPASGTRIEGRVRTISPVVDPQTRNGLVYVDLPDPRGAKAGMFARGDFEIARSPALTLPQGAVLQRDGFAYVFRVGPDSRVAQVKVATGRRSGELVEITSGLDAAARVVASGAAFLADGDTVRVVTAAPAGAAAPAAAKP